MAVKTLAPEEMRSLPTVQLLEEINYKRLSLLKSIGADDLRKEMVPTGLVCRALVAWICREKDDSKLRAKAAKLLKFLAPADLMAPFPGDDCAVVAGFNHPSLGEIFRLIYLGFEKYPEREFLFPVNIPWYEALTPAIPNLDRLGIKITPMITPSTDRKLNAKFADNEARLTDVRQYKVAFERRYMRAAIESSKKQGIIFVAPSATRQQTVFADEAAARGDGRIYPTMTLLAHMVLKKPEDRAVFLPVAIFAPKRNNRKLNLFKTYGICPCEPFPAEETRQLSSTDRGFDYAFLRRIEDRIKGE